MFKMFFIQPQSRAHIFITQHLFNERLSVAGYKLPFGDKICGNHDQTVTILRRHIFAFAKFVLLISNVLMVRKGELFIKSSKLQ